MDESQDKYIKQSSLSLINLAIALAGVLLLVVMYRYWVSNNDEVLITEEEKQAIAETIIDSYQNQTAPVIPEGLSDNHGLSETSEESEINGQIIFSGQKIGDPRVTHLYSLDFSNLTTDVMDTDRFLPDESTSAMAEFVSQNDPDQLFFLGRGLSETNENFGTVLQKIDLADDSKEFYSGATGDGARDFNWNDVDKLLAYSRMGKARDNLADLLSVRNWEVVIFEPEVNQVLKTLPGAAKPIWSPDGSKLLYLKEDGLYAYDLWEETESQLVGLPEGGKNTGSSMFDVSPQGDRLVWTISDRGVMVMFEIVSWENLELVEIGRITDPATMFYWPIFSPDGKHYVVQAIDAYVWSEEEQVDVRNNPRFEVRSTEGREVVYTYPLDEFAFNLLLTDDWIE